VAGAPLRRRAGSPGPRFPAPWRRSAPAAGRGAGATLPDRMPHTKLAVGDTLVTLPPRTAAVAQDEGPAKGPRPTES